MILQEIKPGRLGDIFKPVLCETVRGLKKWQLTGNESIYTTSIASGYTMGEYRCRITHDGKNVISAEIFN